MKLVEYQEHYHMAPYELYEFAERADEIEDCEELRGAGAGYLEAKLEFEKMLAKYKVEVG